MRRANERIWGAGGAMKIRSLTFFLTWCFLFTGCASVNTNRYLISDAEGSEDYTKTLQTYLSEYEMRESTDSLYAETASGNAVACLDVQAIPAMERGVGRYWYPHVLCTVVIAVDRTQTDASITGWNSLLEIPDTVGVASTSVIRNMLVMGALSYGLNPKDPNKQKALDFLEGLSQNGRFELENMEAPVLLCMDYEAAAWNQNGGNYEIIVPMEGTLSFRMGLLSDVPLTLEHGLDQALLSAGLPLVTGERPQGFPKDYRSTRMLEEEDYDWFLKIAGNSSSDLRRQVFHTRLYTTADLKEHILSAIFVIAAILLWNGIQQNDSPGCSTGRQCHGMAHGRVAIVASFQISVGAGYCFVQDVLVWILCFPVSSAGDAFVSDCYSGEKRGGKTAVTSIVAALRCLRSFSAAGDDK